MNEPGSKAAIKAAWVTGVLTIVAGILAAIIGLGLPFVEKLANKAESTPVIIVVVPTVPQPTTQPSTATRQVPPEASPTTTHLPPATSTSSQVLPHVTARIEFPQDQSTIGENVTVTGTIFNLQPGQRAFLCIKSLAYSRLTYPQEEIIPDTTGHWIAEGIYRSPGYNYETYVVVTDNPNSAETLADKYYRANGMNNLPPDTSIISPVIVVVRR